MTRIGLGCCFLGTLLSTAVLAQQAGSPTASVKELKLGEFTVYSHASSGTFIAVREKDNYFGTAEHVVPFVRGETTQQTAEGITVKYTSATSGNKQGLLLYCSGGNRFYDPADEATWAKLPKGKDTVVPVCSVAGGEGCKVLTLPCGAQPKVATAPATKPNGTGTKPNGSTPTSPPKPDSKVVPAGAVVKQGAVAPGVTLIEGERVKPEEAMIFTRSVLIEEGPSVAAMNQYQENINTVRHNMNTYRLGYALPAEKVNDRYAFTGSVKGWRATSTGDVSMWPPAMYPASRDETMRRAKLLDPIPVAEPIDEMNNLRVYYFHSLIGHDGRQYIDDPTAIAFLIHPKTGYRMTVMLRAGRTYGSVNGPLATTSNIYIQDVASYRAGPLGLGTARVPSIFYSKTVRFDVEPFAEGDNFGRLMTTAIAARNSGPLSTADFRALFDEMCRYTGGKVE